MKTFDLTNTDDNGQMIIHLQGDNANYTVTYDNGTMTFENIGYKYVVPAGKGDALRFYTPDRSTGEWKYDLTAVRTLHRDTTPTDFGISDILDVEPSSSHITEEITVGGINHDVAVIAPAGVQIYINNVAVDSGTLVTDGDVVKFEITAPAEGGVSENVTMSIGEISKTVNVSSISLNPSFTVSPSIGGKTTWDMSTDGLIGVNGLNSKDGQDYVLTPQSTFQAEVKLWGGGGGADPYNVGPDGGGAGAVTATVTFVKDQEYKIYAASGGKSGNNSGDQGGIGGYGGGASAGAYGDNNSGDNGQPYGQGGLNPNSPTTNSLGGGGGGATALFLGTTKDNNNALLVAAGGGGGGYDACKGGAGGGETGQNAIDGGGTGGSQTGAGSGGGTAKDGGAGFGGAGDYRGGGGGAGYFGGGGGGDTPVGAGGGGSSFISINNTYVASGTHYAGNGVTPGNNTDSDKASAGTGVPGNGNSVDSVWAGYGRFVIKPIV